MTIKASCAAVRVVITSGLVGDSIRGCITATADPSYTLTRIFTASAGHFVILGVSEQFAME